jgi:hypothetical protein
MPNDSYISCGSCSFLFCIATVSASDVFRLCTEKNEMRICEVASLSIMQVHIMLQGAAWVQVKSESYIGMYASEMNERPGDMYP